jgi:hypothetical protein
MRQIRLVPQLAMNSPAKREFLICVSVWLALELICLAIVFRSPYEQRVENIWLILSLPFGILGSLMITFSPRLAVSTDRSHPRFIRFLSALQTMMLAWLGFLGIAFPLVVIAIQIFLRIFSRFPS